MSRKYFIIFIIIVLCSTISSKKAVNDTSCEEDTLSEKQILRLNQMKLCQKNQYLDDESGNCKKVPGGGIRLSAFPSKNCSEEQFMMDPNNSTYYLYCGSNTYIHALCPDDEEFSLELRRCARPNYCKNDTVTTTENSINTTTNEYFSTSTERDTSTYTDTPVELTTYIMSRVESTTSSFSTDKIEESTINDNMSTTEINSTTDSSETSSESVISSTEGTTNSIDVETTTTSEL
ncbi:hypothetical protein PV326_004428, partial [Microctonus aethiopoides]